MIDSVADFINTFIVAAFGLIGWVIKRIVTRLDVGDKRLTKIEVELATQRERDAAVESRIGKVENAINEMHNKIDRMMEILIKK